METQALLMANVVRISCSEEETNHSVYAFGQCSESLQALTVTSRDSGTQERYGAWK